MKRIVLSMLLLSMVCCAEEITLEGSVKYALEHSQKILTAKEKIKAAEGSLTSATALNWPQLSVMGGYTRTSGLMNLGAGSVYQLPVLNPAGIPTGDTVAMAAPAITTDRIGDIYIGKLSASYTLFAWGKIQGSIDIAFNNKLIADEEYKKTVSDTILDIKKDFYLTLLSKKLTEVLAETKKSLEAHVTVVEKRYEDGLASKFEVLRTKVQLSNVEPQLTRAESQYDISVMAFNMDLGADISNKFIPTGEMKYEKETFDLANALVLALQARNEIKQMEYRIKLLEAALGIAGAGNKPMIILTGDYQTSRGSSMPPDDTVWTTSWDAGIMLTMPFFDGFATTGKFDEANSNLNQAKLAKDQLIKGITIEVKSAYLTLVASEKTIIAQTDNVEAAKESLKIANQRYEQGLATNIEVLDTEVAVLQAQVNYLQALYDYNVSKEKLKKAMGSLGGENAK